MSHLVQASRNNLKKSPRANHRPSPRKMSTYDQPPPHPDATAAAPHAAAAAAVASPRPPKRSMSHRKASLAMAHHRHSAARVAAGSTEAALAAAKVEHEERWDGAAAKFGVMLETGGAASPGVLSRSRGCGGGGGGGARGDAQRAAARRRRAAAPPVDVSKLRALTEEDTAHYRRLFEAADGDGSGELDRLEVKGREEEGFEVDGGRVWGVKCAPCAASCR